MAPWQIQRVSERDVGFEGLILKDAMGRRTKLKSPVYVDLHTLKYRGWKEATPLRLLRLHCRGLTEAVLTYLSRLVEPQTVEEIRKRSQLYCTRWEEHHTLFQDLTRRVTCFRESGGKATDVAEQTADVPQWLHYLWYKGMKGELGGDRLWEEHVSLDNGEFEKVVARLFPVHPNLSGRCNDPILDLTHPVHCCRLPDESEVLARVAEERRGPGGVGSDDGLAETAPIFDDTTGGWHTMCFCGERMKLVRLKRGDVHIYRSCVACGSCYDALTYRNTILLWMCTCGCTHEAHQKDATYGGAAFRCGQPLGVPCSKATKSIRLAVHDLINEMSRLDGHSKDECYRVLSEALHLRREQTHMARMGARLAVQALRALWDYWDTLRERV